MTLAAAVINACRHNGAVVQLCASNYSHAEAASVLGGGASVLQPPAEPVKTEAPGPPGTLGPGEPPPLLWAVVQSFVDGVWPNGDVAGLHAAAGCWRTFGAAAGGMQRALNASKTLIGTQQMPEGDVIIQALSQMGDTTGKLGEQCGQMAATLDEFANQVAQAQNAIRDLLHQLESLGDLWNDVVSILDGDALDEIKRIARDVNAVLRNLGREAREFEQGITLLMQVADGLVVNMEKSMRGQFTHFLGDAVGNQVANISEKFINGNEGFVKEAIKAVQGPADLNPGWFVVDPKGAAATWKSTLEDQFKPSLLNEILNPQEGGEANLQMWKSLLHLDDWGGNRPGMGQGELGFDVAASFIPRSRRSRSGQWARAAEGASEAETVPARWGVLVISGTSWQPVARWAISIRPAPVSPKTSTTSNSMCPRRIRYPVVVPAGRQLLSRSRRRLSRHRVLSNPRRRAPPHHTRRRHRALDGLSLRSSRMSPRQCQQVALGNRRRCPQPLACTCLRPTLKSLNRYLLGRGQSTGRR